MLEFEQLLKVQFAEHGTKEDALATLAAARAWVLERNEENVAAVRASAAGEGPFQGRVAINSLAGRFVTDFYAMVKEWPSGPPASWRRGRTTRPTAEVDLAELRETVRRAERTAGSGRSS